METTTADCGHEIAIGEFVPYLDATGDMKQICYSCAFSIHVAVRAIMIKGGINTKVKSNDSTK